MYDKPNNQVFINKIEKAQYDAALAYAELGLESQI